MNNVPSSPKKKGQPPTPVELAILRNSETKKRRSEAEVKFRTMTTQAEHWRDYNLTWLDTYFNAEIATEYRTVARNHYYGHGINEYTNLSQKRRDMANEIGAEVSKLESIHNRLPIWATKTSTIPSSPTGQAPLDAPIFIVHGSDTLRAESVAHTVTRATSRKTIILRDEPNLGRTLIEKFEQHAAEVAYAIIVLTADDKGGRANEPETRPRGRQNVIFEMGYFFGLIGRHNVSVLIRPGVEKPSDMDGIAYIPFDDNGAWKTELLRELRHAGFDI